jgi:hypothetical protein
MISVSLACQPNKELFFGRRASPLYDFLDVCTLTPVNSRATCVLLQCGQAGGGLCSYSAIVNSTEKSFWQSLQR